MLWRIYSVFDNKARAYLQPWITHNSDTAKRIFAESATDAQHLFSRHAEDYTLFEIGTFDDNTGAVESTVPAINLGLAAQHKPPGANHGNGTA